MRKTAESRRCRPRVAKTILVRVTNRDIKYGKRGPFSCCTPIGRAMSRALKAGRCGVFVWGYVWVFDDDDKYYPLPPEAQRADKLYQRTGWIQPMTFTITLTTGGRR